MKSSSFALLFFSNGPSANAFSGDGSGEEPCEYVFENSTEIICDPMERGVRISKCGLEPTPFTIDDLYMESTACRAVDGDDGWYYFLVDNTDCSANRNVNDTHISYSAAIMGSVGATVNNKISRVRNFGLDFTCDLLVDYVISAIPVTAKLHFIEMEVDENSGSFPVSMAIYEDESFSAERADGDVVTVPDPVHLAVHVDNQSSLNIVTQLVNCWATPDNNADNPIRFPFIENSCGLDSELYEYETLEVLANGEATSARFAIDSFLFDASEESPVFFHCEVRLCDADIENCVPDCSTDAGRKRRSADDSNSAVLSSKPVTIRRH
ncbi:Oidioi.mRNA.OKI2018_I69.chr1.g1178.t1.cds [Oikopleura dioica]|uniref:Oidioi.mRNA.OKI2018_I69.chr1.g1178.t1.cds n=1 Tax=Oikopleura dioica TaxID=34765 RepID=A0ABN7SRD2_OIKDI|nr:Oidioi.mRNA.OKI2018_I69.chr1.g1178.t1.cds [Oikopleura dioica]